MEIVIIGTGYVGLVTGTCLAEMGNKVTCLDINEAKIAKMQSGVCPIYEPGLESLMKNNIEENRLFFSTSYEKIRKAEVVFLAVGTPPLEDGSSDLSFLYAAAEQMIPYLKDDVVVVLKSTVPLGTGLKLRDFFNSKGCKNFSVVNNPEFLKEGSAVSDFMGPDRVIIGSYDKKAGAKIEELYSPFMRQSKRTIHMSNISAEMTKYAANCFLATKVSFINEIAQLCDLVEADVEEVREGLTTDPRIGAQFLYPGPGYGGSCFPKDIKSLMSTALKNGMELKIVRAAEDVNSIQKSYMANKVLKHFGQNLEGKTITIWGAAFKANTDDIRETAAIETASVLKKAGAKIRFYDPEAGENFQRYMNAIEVAVDGFENKYDALNGAHAVVLLTEWKQFRSPDFEEMKSRLKEHVIFDARNLYSGHKLRDMGFTYYGIGKK